MFLPTDLVRSLLGNYSSKMIGNMKKKKGLQYKDVNPSINYNHEKLEAIQGALGEGWEVSTHSLQLLE